MILSDPKRRVGKGYSVDREEYLNVSCLNLTDDNLIIDYSDANSLLTTDLKSEEHNLYVDCNIKLTKKVSVGVWKFKITKSSSMTFAYEMQETDRSASFILKFNSVLPKLRLSIDSYGTKLLTNKALLLYENSPDEFIQFCGNKFVIQETLGIGLHIGLKLDFHSKVETISFKGNDINLIQHLFKFPTKAPFNSERVDISIYVLETYIHPDTLNFGLKSNRLREKIKDCGCSINTIKTADNENSSLMKVDCGKKYGEKFKKVLTVLLDYSTEELPDIISSYYQTKNVEIKPFTKETYEVSYETIGLSISSSPFVQEIKNIRENLAFLYNQVSEYSILVQNLLKSSNSSSLVDNVFFQWSEHFLQVEAKDTLQKEKEFIIKEQENIQNLLESCYRGFLHISSKQSVFIF